MRRNLLVVGVVVVAIAVVWWWRHRSDAAPTASAAQTAPASSTTASPRTPELPGSAAVPSPQRPSRLPVAEPQVNTHPVQARIADAHAHLQDAVKPCRALITPKPSADAQVQFGYRLTFADGEARISELSLVWSDFKSIEVEHCLLDKLGAARWSTTEADGTTTVEDALTAGELE